MRRASAKCAAASSSISALMQTGRSTRAEMISLSVNSLNVHQARSLRIHLTKLVPLSALPVFINFMTIGAHLSILAACGDGGSRSAVANSLKRGFAAGQSLVRSRPVPLDVRLRIFRRQGDQRGSQNFDWSSLWFLRSWPVEPFIHGSGELLFERQPCPCRRHLTEPMRTALSRCDEATVLVPNLLRLKIAPRTLREQLTLETGHLFHMPFWRRRRPRRGTMSRRNSPRRRRVASNLNSRSNGSWRTGQSRQWSLRACERRDCRKNELLNFAIAPMAWRWCRSHCRDALKSKA